MAEYGIPYMGSKSNICDELIRIFPSADNFYDLFGGGFSVTHAMILRRKNHYKAFHFNEIKPGVCDLIKDAINGKYNYNNFKPEWVSREKFFSEKESNPYIKICWSFGNNGRNYMFGDEIEDYKKSMHQAIVFNEFDDLAKQVFNCERFKDEYSIKQKRLFLRSKIEYYRKTKIPNYLIKFLSKKQIESLERLQGLQRLQHLQQLQQLERLEQLQGLEGLQRLEQLEKINFYNKSYDQINIRKKSVIYCDIPYHGKAKYDDNKNFNHRDFFDWAAKLNEPVFVSEYEIKDKRFKLIFEISKLATFNPKNLDIKQERIYVNDAGFKAMIQEKKRGIKKNGIKRAKKKKF